MLKLYRCQCAAHAEEYRLAVHPVEGGGRYVDCGIDARGGLGLGIELARICLGGLGQVSIVPGELGEKAIPLVQVVTDHPVQACLASQYAGWALKEGKFFAMGSGPMRAAAGSEAIFDVIDYRETADQVVGVLETRKPPSPPRSRKRATPPRRPSRFSPRPGVETHRPPASRRQEHWPPRSADRRDPVLNSLICVTGHGRP